MEVAAVIQARVGSTRLPGKVMYPLDGTPTIATVVERVGSADAVDEVIVATSTEPQDRVIADTGARYDAIVSRGSESDVLDRVWQAVTDYDPAVVVRITADCPLIDPAVIDATVETLRHSGADYASNTMERTFPRGFDVEAFTFESFARVHEEATESHHREHVTPYYNEHQESFYLEAVTSAMVYDEGRFTDRTDLRLTLDEAADYELLRRLYAEIPYEGILPAVDAIDYIDEHDLGDLNAHVEQKEVTDASGD